MLLETLPGVSRIGAMIMLAELGGGENEKLLFQAEVGEHPP
ncbi:MAG: IS110 family transposase [Deltaproteobacteria bacterium]|nr:IS110 family transposase [Deltaproteobacteria bacterium]